MRGDEAGGERPAVWGDGGIAEEEVDEVAGWECVSTLK